MLAHVKSCTKTVEQIFYPAHQSSLTREVYLANTIPTSKFYLNINKLTYNSIGLATQKRGDIEVIQVPIGCWIRF